MRWQHDRRGWIKYKTAIAVRSPSVCQNRTRFFSRSYHCLPTHSSRRPSPQTRRPSVRARPGVRGLNRHWRPVMAVVGPSRHSRVSMSLMQGSTNGGPVGNHQQASASQQFFHAQQQSHHATQSATAHSVDYKPDRPIGYGAFGVVWWVHTCMSAHHRLINIILCISSLLSSIMGSNVMRYKLCKAITIARQKPLKSNSPVFLHMIV